MDNALKQKLYLKTIFNLLYEHRYLSGFDLSKKIGKSLTLTNSVISKLVNIGLIVEAGLAESSGGRKPIVYSLNSEAYYIVTVSMDQFSAQFGLLDLANNVILPIETINISLNTCRNLHEILLLNLEKIISSSNFKEKRILGIGVAMPGFVDSKNGINYSFVNELPKKDTLRNYIQDNLNIPVFIDNDSSIIALAEKKFGLAKDTKNAMVVNFGWGIGLGIISNGELYRGEDGFAGEFSHIPLFNNNKICSCGKIGCLETETSFSFILEKLMSFIDEGRPSLLAKKLRENENTANLAAFFRAVESGDLLSLEVLSEAAYNIGRGIAILIHIFNPKKIIISGKGALLGNILLPPIQQAINEHCINRLASNITLEISQLKQNAELIGAACLVVDHMSENLF
ncbi:ROK family protein [Rhizosphaericola mali]|uniref:ROK family protein n=1 Tax=Rhizosphaericola mali TaxID=2545455 RepID=A0A5P2G6I8_9BACT|nr:ROK family protein [Rhizosphaericola mali]QES89562.1 ROK family protein [Rhizosphaericola mali]